MTRTSMGMPYKRSAALERARMKSTALGSIGNDLCRFFSRCACRS